MVPRFFCGQEVKNGARRIEVCHEKVMSELTDLPLEIIKEKIPALKKWGYLS